MNNIWDKVLLERKVTFDVEKYLQEKCDQFKSKTDLAEIVINKFTDERDPKKYLQLSVYLAPIHNIAIGKDYLFHITSDGLSFPISINGSEFGIEKLISISNNIEELDKNLSEVIESLSGKISLAIQVITDRYNNVSYQAFERKSIEQINEMNDYDLRILLCNVIEAYKKGYISGGGDFSHLFALTINAVKSSGQRESYLTDIVEYLLTKDATYNRDTHLMRTLNAHFKKEIKQITKDLNKRVRRNMSFWYRLIDALLLR